MGFSRKFLAAMGIEGDKVDEIINAHVEVVDALKEERDQARNEANQYKVDAEKLPIVTQELDTLKEEVSKGNADPWEPKYTALKEEFDSYKQDIEAKETLSKKQAAYKELLKNAGIPEKRHDAILKVTDLDKIELDDQGGIKDVTEKEKNIKEEWQEFIPVEGEKGATTPTPPAGNGAGGEQPSYAAQRAAQYFSSHYGAVKEG